MTSRQQVMAFALQQLRCRYAAKLRPHAVARVEVTQRCEQSRDVPVIARRNDIEIESRDRRTLDDGRNAADQNEADPVTAQCGEK